MPRGSTLTLTDEAIIGLFFMQRYRFLTSKQYARAANLNCSTAADQLRYFERRGLLGYFGNTGLAGHGKTPKAYFLTRKGWELLHRESDIPTELLGTHKEIKVEARWSPQMNHRLRTVDLLLSAEVAVRKRPHLAMVKTFLEYRRVKRGTQVVRETTDYVDGAEIADNRIVPDAAFILENRDSRRRSLFFLEMDMATERIVSYVLRDSRVTLHYKLSQYDRYLTSMRFRDTYAAYGEFRGFNVLFVTLGRERVENVRAEMQDLSSTFAGYYRFTTFDEAMGDFLGAIWKSRLLSDMSVYPLVREESAVSG
jgi:Replication-relaxation